MTNTNTAANTAANTSSPVSRGRSRRALLSLALAGSFALGATLATVASATSDAPAGTEQAGGGNWGG